MGVLTTDETLQFLNMQTGDYVGELQSYMDAAEAMWVSRGGPIASTSYTETHDGGGPQIVLRNRPVLAVSSLIESFGPKAYTLTAQSIDGTGTLTSWGYTLDTSTGTITRRAMGSAINFVSGLRNISVTYTAGYGTVPADIRHALLLLVKHMWETQRGSNRRQNGGLGDSVPTGFMWPNRVTEILIAHTLPGIG